MLGKGAADTLKSVMDSQGDPLVKGISILRSVRDALMITTADAIRGVVVGIVLKSGSHLGLRCFS
jgi:hypothetical protein